MRILLIVLLLAGCQALPIPGITAVAPITNIGDDAETINNIQSTDYFAWLVALIGWMAPSPGEMWRGFKDFILQLFRRR